MKRLLGLLFIVLICIMGYLSIQGMLPVSPVIGSGMVPEIKSGTLLVTEPLMVVGARPGDIVVYRVPSSLRDKYGYPPVVARRVVKVVYGTSGMQLLIKGENVDINPFTVNASDIKGVVRYRIPYLGLPLVFLQSRVGMVLVPVLVVLLALLLYLGNIMAAFRRRQRETPAPPVGESHLVSPVLSNRFEGAEKAIESFASTMQQYAQHMDSHTSAIQGLGEASQMLESSAAGSEQILDSSNHAPGRPEPEKEISVVEKVVSDLEKRTQLVLQVRDELEGKKIVSDLEKQTQLALQVKDEPEGKNPDAELPSQVEAPYPVETSPEIVRQSPPGCLGNPKVLYKKEHFAKPDA
jgi:signal peptidase I